MKRLVLGIGSLTLASFMFTGCGSNKFIGTYECNFIGIESTWVINDNNKYKMTSILKEGRGRWLLEDENTIKLTDYKDYKNLYMEYADEAYTLTGMKCTKTK